MTVNTVDDALLEINRLRAINQQLLAALKGFNDIAKAEERDGDDAVWTDCWRCAVEDARAAIAKSERKEP